MIPASTRPLTPALDSSNSLISSRNFVFEMTGLALALFDLVQGTNNDLMDRKDTLDSWNDVCIDRVDVLRASSTKFPIVVSHVFRTFRTTMFLYKNSNSQQVYEACCPNQIHILKS